MKKLNVLIAAALMIGLGAVLISGCKKDDEDEKVIVKGCMDPNSLNYNASATEDDGTCTYAPGTSATELVSKSVTSGPALDGTVDALWSDCQKLVVSAKVPNLVDFMYYGGETYSLTMRSVHDATNIYFLAEWTDPFDSKAREGWFFDPVAKLWKQQNKVATSETDKWYEDKFAMMWATDNSDADWNSTTCYSTCHGVNQTAGYTTTTKHYMNTGQVNDMWHWKRVRTGNPFVNQIDDQKIIAIVDINNPTTTEMKDGGRASDAKTAGGYSDNIQTLIVTGTSTSVTVPKYIIPGATNYYWITSTEISNGTAVLITAVDVNGVLTYATGTIDPALGGFEENTGIKRAPSITTAGPFVGSRGDVAAYGNFTGNGWTLEFKRALTTTDVTNDVQFASGNEYMFGCAIFQNAAIAHGIKTNLKLKFQ
jgi:hypothetical protein